MEGFRPRIEAALERYMSGAELMDCAYPNKRRWWQSLSAEGIEVVSTRNSPALFRAVRECMKLTEIEFGDVEASKAALTEFLVMRNAAESAAGTPRTESHAEKVMRVQREQREQESRSPPPPPPPPPPRIDEEGEECREGWRGDDCDRCAPGFGGERCSRLASVDENDCMPGWAGEDCDECAPGFGGELCEPLAVVD
jgi:hypothetical protein